MNAPRRRRRIGGLALAIPLVAFPQAGRAEEPVLPGPIPATAEAIPDLPGIPAPTPAPDLLADSAAVDALPGIPDSPPAAPLPTAIPGVQTAPSPGAEDAATTSPAAEATPTPGSPERVALLTLPPAADPTAAADESKGERAADPVIPTGITRPYAGTPSPQAGGPAAVRPSEQGQAASRFAFGWKKPFTPTERVTTPPAIHNQARTGAGHFADGAGKVVCGVGKMLRGTGQMIGSGFHLLGNTTEKLFGAGENLMDRGGHKLFNAAHEVAPGLGTATPQSAAPRPEPPPRIVPTAQFPTSQSGS